MFIHTDLLLTWGGVVKRYKKNETVFFEGDHARYFYQIIEGDVRLCCYNDEGKEFTQGKFSDGDSFGEPPLFADELYPASAICETNCVIIKISKDTFIKILDEYPYLQRQILVLLSKRLVWKSQIAKELINQSPSHRLTMFLTNYKKLKANSSEKVIIPYTRQELANFLGLRVETVIRTLKKMEAANVLEIRNRKLYF